VSGRRGGWLDWLLAALIVLWLLGSLAAAVHVFVTQ
jgi:hypothetical protein